jgi:hypothetical protein
MLKRVISFVAVKLIEAALIVTSMVLGLQAILS